MPQRLTLPNCPICFDQFEELANISACACGHTFHHDCITKWAKNSQAQGQPSLCPTCKKRFETNAARGVIKKLFFTFDPNSNPPRSGGAEQELKEQIEISEALLNEAETRNGEIEELRRDLDHSRKTLLSVKHSLVVQKIQLEDKLQVSEAMVMSLRDDKSALEKKNNVLNEIVSLITSAGLATSNAALYEQAKPEYQSSSSQLDDTEEKKKKKKKKKGKGEDTDTIILLPEQPIEEKENFVMPNPMRHLETTNRFATLHGKVGGVGLPERPSKNRSPVGDENNNGNVKDMHGLVYNSTSINSVLSSASGDDGVTASDIFYSASEDEAVNPGKVAIPGWRQEFSLRDGRDLDRQLEGVFMFSNIIQPPVLHHGSVLVALMNVPPNSELKDYVNLLPGTIDVKIGKSLYYLPELEGPKTRAIAAFKSVDEADRVASYKQIYWSDVIVPLKKVCKIKGVVPGRNFVREMTENLDANAEATGSKVFKSCDFLKYPLNCLVEMEEVPTDYKLQDLKSLLPEIVEVKMGKSTTHPKKHPNPKTRALAAFSSAKDAAHALSLGLVLTKSNDVILLKKVDTGPNSLLPKAAEQSASKKPTTSSYSDPSATAKRSQVNTPISQSSTLSKSTPSPPPRPSKTAAMASTKTATKTVTAPSKTAAMAATKIVTTSTAAPKTVAATTTSTAATKTTTTTTGNTPQSGSPVNTRPTASTSGSATGFAPLSTASPVPPRFPHPPPMRPQIPPNQYQSRSGYGGYGHGGYGYRGYRYGGYGDGYDYGYGGYRGYGPRSGY